MRCDAGPEIERDAVEVIACSRGAIAAALLQAVNMRIAKIPASRTLGEVAAKRREMTDLRRGKAKRGGGDAGIGLLDAAIGGDRCDGRERADGGRAVGAPDDAGIISRCEIDHGASGYAGA